MNCKHQAINITERVIYECVRAYEKEQRLRKRKATEPLHTTNSNSNNNDNNNEEQ